MAGSDLVSLQQALTDFAAATNHLAQIQMNEVLRRTLQGESAEQLDADKI